MGKFQDLTGQTFGRLAVIECVGKNKHGNYLWRCRCSCGNEIVTTCNALRRENTQSCGCIARELSSKRFKKHGMTRTRAYRTWQGMKNRCYNPKYYKYNCYGGRGIKVCDRWLIFENFYEDVSKLEHFNEDGYSLDRIDVNGDYCPENCRFVTQKDQCRNQRRNIKVKYQGEEMTLAQASELSGLSYTTLKSRYLRGERGDRLFRPVK